jgi:hypothetical protein
MARFLDLHEDLQLPGDAIARLAEDARNARADQFGVRQIELYHNAEGKVYCVLDGVRRRTGLRGAGPVISA